MLMLKRKVLSRPITCITDIEQIKSAQGRLKEVFADRKYRDTASTLMSAYCSYLKEKEDAEPDLKAYTGVEVQKDWIHFDFTNERDFQNTIPAYCLINGKIFYGLCWQDILIAITKYEIQYENTALEELYLKPLLTVTNDNSKPYFLKEQITGRDCIQLPNKYWIDIDYDTPQLMTMIKVLCTQCGYEYNQILIYGVLKEVTEEKCMTVQSTSEMSKTEENYCDQSTIAVQNPKEELENDIITRQQSVQNKEPGESVEEKKVQIDHFSTESHYIDNDIDNSEVLKKYNEDAQFGVKLISMRRKVKKKENIGIDLIELIGNKSEVTKIHNWAEKELIKNLNSFDETRIDDPEIVVISLSLIALQKYNGSYYKYVEQTYSNLYKYFSSQKIEGRIRTILKRYRPADENYREARIINVALRNAIVPLPFLSSFFDFIYDIYKINFEYELSEDLYEDFNFVYEGIRDSLNSEGDDLKLSVTKKSYKLIKTTKDLIINRQNMDSVIELSIRVVQIIDKKIWNQNPKIPNSYFGIGYTNWAGKLNKKEKEKRVSRKVSHTGSHFTWEPEYILDDNTVYLKPPVHKINNKYDYKKIHIEVVNGTQILYQNFHPVIKEIIGGYMINQDRIRLDKPLGKISYRLLADDESIYDSYEKLYREAIAFSPLEGRELYDHRDYDGDVIFCHKEENTILNPFYNTPDYVLSMKKVSCGDIVKVDQETYHFYYMEKPGILGDKYEGQYLRQNWNGKLIDVFSKVDGVVFEKDANENQCEISINNRSFMLTKLDREKRERNGIENYKVFFSLKDPGVYHITVNEISRKGKKKIANFEFGLDLTYSQNIVMMDNTHYQISVDSSFLQTSICKTLVISEFEEDWLKVEKSLGDYSYLLPLTLHIYRIDNGKWKPMTDEIWVDDLKSNSVLDIYGSTFEYVEVLDSKDKKINDNLILKKKGVYSEVPIGFLISYKNSTDYIKLCFTSGRNVLRNIYCYNHCVMDIDNTEIQYDSSDKSVTITPSYYGKGDVWVEIINDDENAFISNYKIIKNETYKISYSFHSFTEYRFCFYEKAKGLNLSLRKNRSMLEIHKVFYDLDDFTGRSFKISKIFYDKYISNSLQRNEYNFKKVYIKFKERLTFDSFIGEIYATTYNGIYLFNNINPVNVVICSEEIDQKMELSITKDGDGLLLDFQHHSIMNSLDSRDAYDIYSYLIDLNGV